MKKQQKQKKKKQSLTLDTLYCFISQAKDGEGICAFLSHDTWMPMVGHGNNDLSQTTRIAQLIADETGHKIELCEFSNRKHLKTITPVDSVKH